MERIVFILHIIPYFFISGPPLSPWQVPMTLFTFPSVQNMVGGSKSGMRVLIMRGRSLL